MANKKKVSVKEKENKKDSAKESTKEQKSVLLSSLPQNILKIGGQVEEDKNIYISQATYKAIHNFTKDKHENESGGILMGYTLDGAGKTNIIIDGFIEAKHCEATPTTLKFTHETWEYIYSEADKKYPEYKIIGWIHTHPSFGIFLSEYDKFIQQNFFNGENQIAYVVDPIQKTEGFYFWINGKIEKCKGFYIYDKTGTPISIEMENEQNENQKESNTQQVVTVQKNKAWKDYLLILTSVIAIIMLFITLSVNSKISDLENGINRISAAQEKTDGEINTLLNQILLLNQEINSLETDLENAQSAIANIQTSVSQNKTEIDNAKNAIESTKNTIDAASKDYKDNKYNCEIIFLNDDGSVISKTEYKFGDKITAPTPTKASDNTYDYVFAGWDVTPELATDNSIFVAIYTPVYREYTVKFVGLDNEEIATSTYHYGDTVIVPEYTAEPKESEEPYSYEYVLTWDKTVTTVEGDTVYTAIYEKRYIIYTVDFVSDDGTLIERVQCHYNDVINTPEPTKESTDTHSYTFIGWDKEVVPVTKNDMYTAIFEEKPIEPTQTPENTENSENNAE